jgi:fatty acid/phospholipid biosynthesis enzyme
MNLYTVVRKHEEKQHVPRFSLINIGVEKTEGKGNTAFA